MNTIRLLALGLALAGLVTVTGCVTDNLPSGDSYPEYNCWWR